MIGWFEVPRLQLGSLSVEVPTVLAFAASIAALWIVRLRARVARLSIRRAVDGVFSMLLGGLVLGHLFDVFLYQTGDLRENWRVILPWHGGFCSLGAIVGLVAAASVAFRSERDGVRWQYLDHAVMAIVAGLGILRIGCFLGHHHAGRLSNCFLAVAYPGGARHDLGLEEAILVACSWTALTIIEHRSKRLQVGDLAASTMLIYGVGRFNLEWLRGDDIELLGRQSDPRYAGMTAVQYAALALFAFGAGLLLSRRRRWRSPWRVVRRGVDLAVEPRQSAPNGQCREKRE